MVHVYVHVHVHVYIYGKIIFVWYFILPKLQEVKKMISQYGENMYICT